ncbi:hypothetical protein NQ318_004576 [Aromia moschata]|uniref:ATP-dependent RNA helicase n=1 Tax=Aromia moschata TaxID=1265417 RepID=A0AAV8X4X4_9CUCU|nr:hypothetical protein NQ318_004576 [Aromia moschata]
MPMTLIKRKQKKDKLAAKAAAEEENNTSLSSKATQNQTHSLFAVGHKDIHVNMNLKGKSIVEKVFSKGKTFSDLNIHKYLISNLERSISKLLRMCRKNLYQLSCLVRSQTGSGKTLAYAIPIIDAIQYQSPFTAAHSSGLLSDTFVVVRTETQRKREYGKEHIDSGEDFWTTYYIPQHFKVDNVRCLVLDEADRLLDMGFKRDIVKIVEELNQSQ